MQYAWWFAPAAVVMNTVENCTDIIFMKETIRFDFNNIKDYTQ